MRCITLWQPWATLVVIGAKRLETRSWPCAYRGPLAIHAAKAVQEVGMVVSQRDPFRAALLSAGYATWFDLPLGCVLGTVHLTGCVSTNVGLSLTAEERAFGDYNPGRFAWTLEGPILFPQPIPARGKQGLWEWTYDH